MRPTKFRGKRIDNGEWVYGYYVKIGEYYYPPTRDCYIVAMDGKKWVDPETVGQFTGLKDKAGVEIYEGDIVRFEGYVGEFYEEGRREMLVGKVFYKTKGSVDYCVKVDGHNYGLNSNEISKYEAIGDIHSNPELLEEKAK